MQNEEKSAPLPLFFVLHFTFYIFHFHPRRMQVRLLLQIVLVSLGSALGGLARWGMGVGAARLLGSALPWGTFFINISGSLFLGWFSSVISERLGGPNVTWIRPDDLRLLVAVGFTGSYTTFSTFEYETHHMLKDGDSLLAILYIGASVFLGLLAVRLGAQLAG
jgi:CrcB protein